MLISSENALLLTPIKELQGKKIIGLAECTNGSQTIKDWTYILLKNLILTNNCKLIITNGHPDLLIKINAYIQGLLPEKYELEIEEQIRLYYFDDYISRFNFIKWLRQYNESTNEKVHYLGVDTFLDPKTCMFDFFMSVFGSTSEVEKSYLIKIHKKQYTEVLQEASNDRILEQRLGKEFYEYFIFILKELVELPRHHDYRGGVLEWDKVMSQRVIKVANIFLTGNKTSAIIAHSNQLTKSTFHTKLTTNRNSLGYYLNHNFGNEYYNINFLVGHEDSSDDKFNVEIYRKLIGKLAPNPKASLESRFMALDYDVLFYPSNKLETDIYETRSLSMVGTQFDQFMLSNPNKEFNAYIFIRQSKLLSNLGMIYSPKYVNNIEARRVEFLKANGLNWSNLYSPKPGQLTNDY